MKNGQTVWDYMEYKMIWEEDYVVKFPGLVPAESGAQKRRRNLCTRKLVCGHGYFYSSSFFSLSARFEGENYVLKCAA